MFRQLTSRELLLCSTFDTSRAVINTMPLVHLSKPRYTYSQLANSVLSTKPTDSRQCKRKKILQQHLYVFIVNSERENALYYFIHTHYILSIDYWSSCIFLFCFVLFCFLSFPLILLLLLVADNSTTKYVYTNTKTTQTLDYNVYQYFSTRIVLFIKRQRERARI